MYYPQSMNLGGSQTPQIIKKKQFKINFNKWEKLKIPNFTFLVTVNILIVIKINHYITNLNMSAHISHLNKLL